jgi:hypothetical protein
MSQPLSRTDSIVYYQVTTGLGAMQVQDWVRQGGLGQ